ncbi:MAG: phosphoribosylformylglycinamidine synthase subunit PurQ [Pseudomonadota bacterium]
MKVAVITFPGSNCDRDVILAVEQITGQMPQILWCHQKTIDPDIDLLIIPGGFSFGDYLRTGAIAAKLPIMNEVIQHAKRGKYILGICNGFQILTECGLLPGTLIRNKNLLFICDNVEINIMNHQTSFTNLYAQEQKSIVIPVAHHSGNFYIDDEGAKSLVDNDQIAFSYAKQDFNGSVDNIAGIFNKHKNILGMMPHPERAMERMTGGIDGIKLFESILNS